MQFIGEIPLHYPAHCKQKSDANDCGNLEYGEIDDYNDNGND